MEILLRVVDKINLDDPIKNNQCTKRGDVIVVVPDGHNWGKEELSNPDWRIIKAPNLTEAATYDFTHADLDINGNEIKRRKHTFDFDNPILSPQILTYLADSQRTNPFYYTEASIENILSLKKLKV